LVHLTLAPFAFHIQPLTFHIQPFTYNLQPTTYNLQPTIHHPSPSSRNLKPRVITLYGSFDPNSVNPARTGPHLFLEAFEHSLVVVLSDDVDGAIATVPRFPSNSVRNCSLKDVAPKSHALHISCDSNLLSRHFLSLLRA